MDCEKVNLGKIGEDSNVICKPLELENSSAHVTSCSFKTRPYLSKDKKLIKDITGVGIKVQGIDGVNNMIRRHFIELTERFLQPLNRYFDSLVIGNPYKMYTWNNLGLYQR